MGLDNHYHNTPCHKQGDSFNYVGPIYLEQDDFENVNGVTYENWQGKAHIRTDDGTIVSELDFSWVSSENGILRVKDLDGTDDWPIGRVLMDIELTTPSGDKISTDTLVILIQKDITK